MVNMEDFEYINLNPMNLNESDCVCRAIALVSGRSYYDIQEKLELTAKLFECDMLTVCCYKNLLNYVFGYEPIKIEEGITVREFAQQNPQGVYLIRMNGHISVIWDSKILDTWYCGNREATHCWKIN